MPAVIFSGAAVKALKDKLQFFTSGSVESGTTDPTSVAVSADAGSLYLNTSNGLVYRKLDAGSSTNWEILGSGADGKNDVVNGKAEANTTGWTAYDDGSSARPVDGTGGSPGITWTRSTSTPLAGLASFLLTKDAADRQGEGVAYDIKIDRADRGKVHTFEFDYEIASGTYSGGTDSTDSDLICYVYRVDATARLIEPTPFKLRGAVAGQNYKHVCQFQADADADDYRIMFHVATTSASAWTMKIDNVKVSPLVIPAAPSISDWMEYTPTITGFGTVSAVDVFSRRVGDTLEVMGSFTAGTVAASTASISLGHAGVDGGVSADTSKIAASKAILGHAAVDLNSANEYTWEIVYGTTSAVYIGKQTNGVPAINVPVNGNAVAGNGNVVTFFFAVPIAGWGSASDVLGGGDGRVVAARAELTGGVISIPDSTQTRVDWDTSVYDTHASLDVATNFNWTCPVAGKYSVKAMVEFDAIAGGQRAVTLYKNGSAYAELGQITDGSSTASNRVGGTTDLDLVAGDYLEVFVFQASGGLVDIGANGSQFNYWTVSRIAGPEQIQAGELVAARATSTSTASAGTGTPVVYETVDFDTHGMVNTTTGEITVPVAGIYRVAGSFYCSTQTYFRIYKNGVWYSQGRSTDTGAELAQGTASIKCVAGDVLSIRPSSTETMANGATGAFFEVERIK